MWRHVYYSNSIRLPPHGNRQKSIRRTFDRFFAAAWFSCPFGFLPDVEQDSNVMQHPGLAWPGLAWPGLITLACLDTHPWSSNHFSCKKNIYVGKSNVMKIKGNVIWTFIKNESILNNGLSGLSTWKYQLSYNHWSKATLSSVNTWMGDCSSVAWVLLVTLKVG